MKNLFYIAFTCFCVLTPVFADDTDYKKLFESDVAVLNQTFAETIKKLTSDECDISTQQTPTQTVKTTRNNNINYDENGKTGIVLNHDGTCDIYDGNEWQDNQDASKCPELSKGHWKVEFSYGTVKGEAKCATNDGTYAEKGAPNGTDGQCCWCKADRSNIVASPSWVFNYDYGNAADCASYCASECAYDVNGSSYFQRAVFGVTE